MFQLILFHFLSVPRKEASISCSNAGYFASDYHEANYSVGLASDIPCTQLFMHFSPSHYNANTIYHMFAAQAHEMALSAADAPS